MRFIIPIVLVILAIAMFFGYIDPTYGDVKEVRAEIKDYNDALDRARELIATRDRLLSAYNSFSAEDLERLRKMLPDHIDAVRLIIDLDSIAARHGIRIEDISIQGEISQSGASQQQGTASASNSPVGIAGFGFSVTTSYETLKQFVMDLEDSLRVIDVASISFGASDDDTATYDVQIKTYWLR